jgi:D-amino-acid dehydrogenase
MMVAMAEAWQVTDADDLPRPIDVAVVGGGVVGLAVARELARRGVAVVVLERDELGRACSYGNAGWLTPSLAMPLAAPGNLRKSLRWLLDPESPLYIPPRLDLALWRFLAGFLWASRSEPYERGAEALVGLCRFSVDRWEELAQGGAAFGFARAGLLAIYEHPAVLAAAGEHLDLVARFGVRHERWSADEVRSREPAVVGPQVGAIFYPDDAHCEPAAAVRVLAAAARDAGARLVERAEVVAVEQREAVGRREVTRLITTRGVVEVGAVVLAAGAWSAELGDRFGVRVPILGAKGYSLVVPPLVPQPQRSLYLAERKVAINPHADALRISGTLELVGTDLGINRRRVAAIERGARGLLALPDPLPVRELWRGLRPCAPDGMPLIGRARGSANLWVATGHQMTGLKTALGTGVLLAELMTGTPPSFDSHPFRADRY